MKTIECAICDTLIDRGECGEQHTIITTKDDRHNRGKGPDEIMPIKNKRKYLCSLCTYRVAMWLRKARVNYRNQYVIPTVEATTVE